MPSPNSKRTRPGQLNTCLSHNRQVGLTLINFQCQFQHTALYHRMSETRPGYPQTNRPIYMAVYPVLSKTMHNIIISVTKLNFEL